MIKNVYQGKLKISLLFYFGPIIKRNSSFSDISDIHFNIKVYSTRKMKRASQIIHDKIKSSNLINETFYKSPTIIYIWPHPITSYYFVITRTYMHTTRNKSVKMVGGSC
jgi:hypothetical protein